MKFPVEHANKVLWLNKHMQNKEHMYGSKKYGWMTYEMFNPKITLDVSHSASSFSCDNWIIDVWVYIDYQRYGKLWNDKSFVSPHLNDNYRYEFGAEYLGDLNNFIETVTYLYLVNQD